MNHSIVFNRLLVLCTITIHFNLFPFASLINCIRFVEVSLEGLLHGMMSSAASGAADFPPPGGHYRREEATISRTNPHQTGPQNPAAAAPHHPQRRSSEGKALKDARESRRLRSACREGERWRQLFMVLKLRRFGKPRSGLIVLHHQTRAARCIYRASTRLVLGAGRWMCEGEERGRVRGPPREESTWAAGRPSGGGAFCIQNSSSITSHQQALERKAAGCSAKASGETQPGPVPAAQAASDADGPVTQQNEALQDEIQTLEDENEDLRVLLLCMRNYGQLNVSC